MKERKTKKISNEYERVKDKVKKKKKWFLFLIVNNVITKFSSLNYLQNRLFVIRLHKKCLFTNRQLLLFLESTGVKYCQASGYMLTLLLAC